MTTPVRAPDVRPLVAVDLTTAHALNEAAVPAVNALGLDDFAAHVASAPVTLAVGEEPGAVEGFVVAFLPRAGYDSPNYRWFDARSDDFCYVDRVVVDPAARGRGVGRALYAAVATRAAELGLARVTCEVNIEPPNPGSMAFHLREGFAEVGRQRTDAGTKLVALLERHL